MESIKSNLLPKITVITPTYNRADFIAETIESVLNQDCKNFEYFILDDGSTDNTDEIVKPYLKDKRVKYLKHNNAGEAETVNWGWNLASGEYFTQVNSDDPILPGLFSEMVRLLDAQKNIVVAYPDFYFIDEKGEILKKDNTPDWNFLDALSTFSCYAASAGTFIRKSTFIKWDKIKDSRFKHISDVEMYWKMALEGDFWHIPKFLATWRVHSGSISAERYKCIPEVKIWFEEYFSQANLPKEVMNCKNKIKDSIYMYCISLINQGGVNNKNELINELNNEYFQSDILHIGDNDLIGNKFNGHDLHKYLEEKGYRSNHLVWNKESNDENTFEVARHRTYRRDLYHCSSSIQKEYSVNGVLNPLWYDVLLDPLFLNANLTHLHLVHNGLIDLHLLPLMSELKPIIWTLHDPWALSGHCIEHFECNKWEKSCYDCPQLNIPFELNKDNSSLNFELKKTLIQNSKIEIIVASTMMFNKVKKSPIFKNKNIHIVPFGIDHNIFKILNKSLAKNRLNIPDNSFVISFRSDTRHKKGTDYIEYVINNLRTEKKVYILSFGGGEFKKNANFNYIEFGWIKDDVFMDVYNASDLFLMPSTVETFGMMAIEAMSCGTIPIVLNSTALPEVVNAPECGVSTARDKEKYLNAVQYYMDNDKERELRAKKCLEFAIKNYSKDRYIEKLIKIYEEVKNKHIISEEYKILLDQLKKNCDYNKLERLPVSNFRIVDQKVIDSLEKEIHNLEANIGKILQSKSWRITAPIRWIHGQTSKLINAYNRKHSELKC